MRKQFDHLIEKIGTSLIYKEKANAVLLLDDYREVVIARVILSVLPDCLETNTVFTSGLKDNYGILVIMKIDPDGNTSEIKADTMIEAGDEIIVVGKREEIVDAFINSPDIIGKTKAVPFSPSKKKHKGDALKKKSEL